MSNSVEAPTANERDLPVEARLRQLIALHNTLCETLEALITKFPPDLGTAIDIIIAHNRRYTAPDVLRRLDQLYSRAYLLDVRYAWRGAPPRSERLQAMEQQDRTKQVEGLEFAPRL